MLWQHFVYPHLEFHPFCCGTHCCDLNLPIPNGCLFWWIITRHFLHRRLHVKTTGRLQLKHHSAMCLLTCASRGSRCASQSFLSVRMQVKMLFFALQNCEWIGLCWLNSKLSWCGKMKLIISDISYEGIIEWSHRISWFGRDKQGSSSPSPKGLKEILALF